MVERRNVGATDALVRTGKELETPKIRVACVVVPCAFVLMHADGLRQPPCRPRGPRVMLGGGEQAEDGEGERTFQFTAPVLGLADTGARFDTPVSPSALRSSYS